jgi:transcriptional regulator with XRE-family HTH domain
MTTNIREVVAEEIRAELGRQRRSASWLGRQTGMAQPAISRRLTGAVPIDLEELDAIARALDVPLYKLLGETAEGDQGHSRRRGSSPGTATHEYQGSQPAVAGAPQRPRSSRKPGLAQYGEHLRTAA